jgi:hypothetical protein
MNVANLETSVLDLNIFENSVFSSLSHGILSISLLLDIATKDDTVASLIADS